MMEPVLHGHSKGLFIVFWIRESFIQRRLGVLIPIRGRLTVGQSGFLNHQEYSYPYGVH